MWGTVLKRDLLGEVRKEDRFHSKEELQEFLISEIKKQGKNVVIRNLDVSLIEDFSHLFESIAYGVKTLDLSGWKTSNVKDMSWMFQGCSSIESLDLSGWDTSNVENMSLMFFFCDTLESVDLSDWDVSNVGDMYGMFCGCESLESLDLSGWNTSKVKDMENIFYECAAPYKVKNNQIVRK